MVPPFLLVIASLFLSFTTSHPSFSLLPPSPCSSPSSLPAVPPFLLVLLLSSSFYLFFLPSISLISEFDEDAGEDKQVGISRHHVILTKMLMLMLMKINKDGIS